MYANAATKEKSAKSDLRFSATPRAGSPYRGMPGAHAVPMMKEDRDVGGRSHTSRWEETRRRVSSRFFRALSAAEGDGKVLKLTGADADIHRMMRLRILPAIAVLSMLSLGVGAYAVSRPANGQQNDAARNPAPQLTAGRAAKARARRESASRAPYVELERKLRQKAVGPFAAVVVFYSPASSLDRLAILEARAGAQDAGAGFAAIDVTRNRAAGELASRYGLRDVPALLVLRRSTHRVMKMVGYTDRAAVAQAVENARRWRF